MSTLKPTILGARVNAGIRYGGANQRIMEPEGRDPAKVKDRVKQFVPQSNQPYADIAGRQTLSEKERQRIHASIMPVREILRTIVWKPGSSLPPFRVNGLELKRIVKRLVELHPSRMNAFYRVLLEQLEHEKFARIISFHVRAHGECPAHDGGAPLHFTKILAQGHEFLLPQSFLHDCDKAFVKELV